MELFTITVTRAKKSHPCHSWYENQKRCELMHQSAATKKIDFKISDSDRTFRCSISFSARRKVALYRISAGLAHLTDARETSER